MSNLRVETISKLAQWTIDNYYAYTQSLPFKLGIWSWSLTLKKSSDNWRILLYVPQPSEQPPPLARCVLRISDSTSRPYISSVREKLLQTGDAISWPIEYNLQGRLIIEVEFHDLKIYPINGGDPISIWSCDGIIHNASSLRCLSRMLDESIYADVTINLPDGTLRAHKALLCACSPVFQAMFHHNLKEKETSVINIEDMSFESCSTLLSYLYGTVKKEDFLKHRLSLATAANKYYIADLKDACEESLLEDIDSGNVLVRLQEAWHYKLDKLKQGCFRYLFHFGKYYDVRDDLKNLITQADPGFVLEIFEKTFSAFGPS